MSEYRWNEIPLWITNTSQTTSENLYSFRDNEGNIYEWRYVNESFNRVPIEKTIYYDCKAKEKEYDYSNAKDLFA